MPEPQASKMTMNDVIGSAQTELFQRELIYRDLQMGTDAGDEGVIVGISVILEFENGEATIQGFGKTPTEALKNFFEALNASTG